jgi:beta-lactam-binding protein with PASTA domain
MTVEEATKRLEAAGFSAGVGGTMASSVEPGRVAATSPYGRAPQGSFVTIYVSEGQPSRSDPKPRETVVLPPDLPGLPDPTKTKGKPGSPG